MERKSRDEKERKTDMEFALYLGEHINKPCEDLNGNKIRSFYIREAKRAIREMRDPNAKGFLGDVIKQYESTE